MQNYLILLAASVLLAGDFAIQKKYQQKSGTGIIAGLTFNVILGAVTAVLFFCINGFRLDIGPYNVIMSTLMSVSTFVYTIIGFRILKGGNIALYSLSSLMGAIVVPYVVGIIYLEEVPTILMNIGVILITVATVLSNFARKRSDIIQLLLCVSVFFLNGAGAVISKLCQTELGYGVIGVNDFVCMTGIVKFVICIAALLLYLPFAKKKKEQGIPKSAVPWIVYSAVVGGISYMLQLIGAAALPASVLFPMVSGASMILSALAGVIFFREKLTPRQIVGIGVCFVGTLLLL